ncbi:MAG: ABATE domain-containing protein [Alphaproteobacteria bacterium]|nr:ABATE domain-containing protein [Alphaproteobacteria bacterium]
MVEADDFVAGAPCLDFVNTVGGIRSGACKDKLESYDDLVRWAVLAETLDRQAGDKLLGLAHAHPDTALRVLRRAKEFREALHAVFATALAQRPPPRGALETLHAEIRNALPHLRLSRDGAHYDWDWEPPDSLDAPLWAVARDAGNLLTSDKMNRLAECASDTCGWYFLDLSKNRSRRWCDMRDCGNRAKVRRYRGG